MTIDDPHHEARPAGTPASIDVADLIGRQHLGGFQLLVVSLCATACFVSGFALVLPGYLVTRLATGFNLHPSALAPVLAIAGLGNVLGELVCAPLADRVGRKPVIVGGLIFAAPFLVLTAYATSLTQIMWLQFFALFALMGLVPNALALAGEFVPKNQRVTLTMVVWLGFELGAIVAGPVTAYVTAAQSWRPMFLISGVMAILAAPFLGFALPESPDVLIRRGKASERIARTLARLDPRLEFSAETRFVVSEKKTAGSPIAALFRDGRARMTVLLWIMFFTNMLALFFVNSWLPTVLHSAGFGEGLAVGLTAVVHVGGILGGLVIAQLCDKVGRKQFYILAVAYALGGISIAALGFGGSWLAFVAIAVFMVGFFTFGVQNTANAVAATIYPGSMRSTGAGWAIGIGNSAQIVAPMFGGVLLSLQWIPSDILYVIALPPGVAAVAAMAVATTTRRCASRSISRTDSASF